MSEEMVIPAGTLVCFSKGVYSGYGYCGHFVALEELTYEKLKRCAAPVKQRWADRVAEQDAWVKGEEWPKTLCLQELFIAEMIRAGLLLIVNCTELHLGDYEELSIPLEPSP